MTPRDAIHAALVRAARGLGAPETVDPVMERPRDPAHGHWATNLAMTLAKPLRQKPREIADALVAALDLARRRRLARRDRRPGLHQFPSRARGERERARGHPRRPATRYGRLDRGRRPPGERRVRLRESHRPAARRTRPPGRARRRDRALLECDRLERVARVLLQRRRRADHESRRSACRRALAQLRRRDVAMPEGGYHGEYIREIAQRYIAEHPSDPNAATTSTRSRAFAVRELRKEQDLDLQAFGVQVRHVLPRSLALLRRPGGGDGQRARRRGPHVRAGRRALAAHHRLRRRQGSRDARSRGRRRTRTSCPTSRITSRSGARLHARDQRAGRRPPQHRDARARRTAGARHRHPGGLSRVRAAPDGDA